MRGPLTLVAVNDLAEPADETLMLAYAAVVLACGLGLVWAGDLSWGRNPWDNPFSNTVALAHTSDGGTLRIGEFRRMGWFPKRNGRAPPTHWIRWVWMRSN